jgi:hypothetical protein
MLTKFIRQNYKTVKKKDQHKIAKSCVSVTKCQMLCVLNRFENMLCGPAIVFVGTSQF